MRTLHKVDEKLLQLHMDEKKYEKLLEKAIENERKKEKKKDIKIQDESAIARFRTKMDKNV